MPGSLGDAVKLPCGLVLPNRFVKAAMAESLANPNHTPNPTLISAYNKWSQGGWGALLTGNVQVDINHLGDLADPALPHPYRGKEKDKDLLALWQKYADTAQQHGTPAIVQIVHPGRQSFRGAGNRGLFEQTIAPSSVPLSLGDGWFQRFAARLVFGVPREMTVQDIERVIRQFVDTARLMADAGFSGIELHGAHGYLIDQFLNPKTNHRTDEYGGTPENRAKFALDILAAIRDVVPPTFCVGIKLNSADHQSGNFEDVMTQIKLFVDAGVDFVEISGGSYENPRMISHGQKAPRTKAREAFFLEFATEFRSRFPTALLMLTGGFRSREGMTSALDDNACDLIGIGRPAVIHSDLPNLLLDKSIPDERASYYLNSVAVPWLLRLLPIRVLGAGAETKYYSAQIGRLARGLVPVAP